MFDPLSALKEGDELQRRAYKTIQSLGVFTDLARFSPMLCGTLPINIHVEDSDLDIIMEVENFDEFEEKVTRLYGNNRFFIIKRTTIRGNPVIKANFHYEDFEFELFGQNVPVTEQYAYLHMIIEKTLLEEQPSLRQEIIQLKKGGLKTEPAFCQVLGLVGDPYEKLLELGRKQGYI